MGKGRGRKVKKINKKNVEKHPPSHAAEETSSQFAASDRVKGIDPSWRTDPHSTFLSSGRGRSGRGVGGGGGGGWLWGWVGGG